LPALQRQILSGNVQTGNYRYFTIYDPKQRLICEAPFRQRVLHHALMNICHPFFEKVQIFGSYASRQGKGTYAALERAWYFNKRHLWFLKLDFRKYFDSLDHEILKNQLHRLFKDSDLLQIFERIIDSYCVEQNKGVPIGNLTSQYFANHYLAHRSRIRFIKKLRDYNGKLASERWTQREYQNHVIPLIAFTEHSNAREFRKKIIADLELCVA
jgi:RNA-directed DNA polymerase